VGLIIATNFFLSILTVLNCEGAGMKNRRKNFFLAHHHTGIPISNFSSENIYLEEITNMTRKASLIFAAMVVSVLFSFSSFAQEAGQESGSKGGEKQITYIDLQTQKETIEKIKTSYLKVQNEYNTECKEKKFESMNDYPKECREKYTQLTKLYSELQNEIESYNKNVAQFKANAQKSTGVQNTSTQDKTK
jgi:hypothetical protein